MSIIDSKTPSTVGCRKKVVPSWRQHMISFCEVMTRMPLKMSVVKILSKILRFIFMPVVKVIFKKRLPHFAQDFEGRPAYMISELPGGEGQWAGQRRRKTQLGNTHPWNRYFNHPLKTKPRSLRDIETFLGQCRYLSDRKTRSQSDFWEPPDVFEQRKTGDCEDHAIWAWRHLHDMGYRCRFVLGNHRRWHAWVHIFVNGRVYLLEATQKHRWFPRGRSYDPWWSVERIGEKKFAFFLHSERHEDDQGAIFNRHAR